MFQEIEEFVKTDPYTKAGLISSWYGFLVNLSVVSVSFL